MTFAPMKRDFHGVTADVFRSDDTILERARNDVVGLDIESAAEPAAVSGEFSGTQPGVTDGSLNSSVGRDGDLNGNLPLLRPADDDFTTTAPVAGHFPRRYLTCEDGRGEQSGQTGEHRRFDETDSYFCAHGFNRGAG